MELNSHSNNLITFLKLFMIFVPSFHKKCHDLGIHMSSFNEIKHGNILFLKIIVLDSNDFIYKL